MDRWLLAILFMCSAIFFMAFNQLVLAQETNNEFPRRQDALKNENREQRHQQAIEKMRRADVNHDHAISREEARNSMPHLSRHFEEIDANHDGLVSQDEIRNFRQKRMQRRLDKGRVDPRSQ